MLNILRNKEVVGEIEKSDDDTQEKLILALLLIMFADGKVTIAENGEIEKILETVEWDHKFRYQGKYGELVARVRDVLDDEAKKRTMIEYIKSVGSREKLQFIISAAKKVAEADGAVDFSEVSIISQLEN